MSSKQADEASMKGRSIDRPNPTAVKLLGYLTRQLQ